MKLYDIVYCIVVAVFISSGLVGCRTLRNAEKTKVTSISHAKNELYRDSTLSEHRTVEQRIINSDLADEYYLRITEYDVEGAIQRISEKWGNRRLSNVDSQERQSESVSVTGSETIIAEVDSSHTDLQEKSDISVDTRPVQGAEWFWIIIALAIIILVAVVVYKYKNNGNNHSKTR